MFPIEGMKNEPMGLPLMAGAWMTCLLWIADKPELRAKFTADTGFSIDALTSQGINRLIDEATGHHKAIVVAFADWVTEHFWGIEGQGIDDTDLE